jgi:hypothetical protein
MPGPLKPLVDALPGAVLAVDANVADLETDAGHAARVAHGAAGGRLILGVFDTRPGRFDRAAGIALARRLIGDDVLAFSGGCGTGLLPPATELELAESLAAVAVEVGRATG